MKSNQPQYPEPIPPKPPSPAFWLILFAGALALAFLVWVFSGHA